MPSKCIFTHTVAFTGEQAKCSQVDFIVEHGGKLIPIEAKLSATPKPTMAPGILAFRKDFPKKAEKGYIIHPGDMKLSIAPNVLAVLFAGL
jgi:predicted AAA+ superfamily ATPase